MTETLTVLAWDHPRAVRPLMAAAKVWPGGVEIARRSLASFGDDVPGSVGADVVLIDHPHIGAAARSGEIVPLDGLIEAEELRQLRRGAVGGSGEVYDFDDRTWAVATDAACLAMAMRPDLRPPITIADLLDAPDHLRIGLPLHPAHAMSAHVTIAACLGAPDVAGAFAETPVAVEALRVLARVVRCCPAESYDWEPPEAIASIEAGVVDCVPFTFGYVGYEVDWYDVPRRARDAAPRPLLGGVGMAVLASSQRPADAAAFAAWYGSKEVQREIVLPAGGQPATLDAWTVGTDPLFWGNARGMANAIARPRDPWWPPFQIDAGRIIVDGLRRGADERDVVAELARRFDRATSGVCS